QAWLGWDLIANCHLDHRAVPVVLLPCELLMLGASIPAASGTVHCPTTGHRCPSRVGRRQPDQVRRMGYLSRAAINLTDDLGLWGVDHCQQPRRGLSLKDSHAKRANVQASDASDLLR